MVGHFLLWSKPSELLEHSGVQTYLPVLHISMTRNPQLLPQEVIYWGAQIGFPIMSFLRQVLPPQCFFPLESQMSLWRGGWSNKCGAGQRGPWGLSSFSEVACSSPFFYLVICVSHFHCTCSGGEDHWVMAAVLSWPSFHQRLVWGEWLFIGSLPILRS